MGGGQRWTTHATRHFSSATANALQVVATFGPHGFPTTRREGSDLADRRTCWPRWSVRCQCSRAHRAHGPDRACVARVRRRPAQRARLQGQCHRRQGHVHRPSHGRGAAGGSRERPGVSRAARDHRGVPTAALTPRAKVARRRPPVRVPSRPLALSGGRREVRGATLSASPGGRSTRTPAPSAPTTSPHRPRRRRSEPR